MRVEINPRPGGEFIDVDFYHAPRRRAGTKVFYPEWFDALKAQIMEDGDHPDGQAYRDRIAELEVELAKEREQHDMLKAASRGNYERAELLHDDLEIANAQIEVYKDVVSRLAGRG